MELVLVSSFLFFSSLRASSLIAVYIPYFFPLSLLSWDFPIVLTMAATDCFWFTSSV